MAVVIGKSTLIRDPRIGEAAVDPAVARGRTISATFTATNASTDNTGSKWHLADLPSDAILDESTSILVSGWGFAAVRIGTKTDVDALVAVVTSAAAVVNPVAIGDAKHGVPLWQVLGLAADPGGNIGLWAHAIANATGAGSLKGKFAYRYR